MKQFSLVCFVINLDRSPDRMQRIGRDLERLGVPYARHTAVDGRLLDLSAEPDFDAQGYARLHGKTAVPNEVGCYLSHMGVMKRFLQTPHAHCLVLEDDALLCSDFDQVLQQVLDSPVNGDLTLLYGNRKHVALTLSQLPCGRQIVGYWGKQTGAVAYLVNRKAAEAFVQHMLPMRLPLDHAFSQVWLMGIRMRGVHPFPVTTGAFESVIGKTGDKFPLRQRLRTLIFRVVGEMRRCRYQLFNDRIGAQALLYWIRKS
jgi:glycosyl transferase family 25